MRADAERRLKVKLDTPHLVAISAAGPAGFRLYNQSPDAYRGYACLASSPTARQASTLNKDLRMLMINGTIDQRYPVEPLRRRAQRIQRRVPGLTFKTIEADHFILLTRREQTFETIRRFVTPTPTV